MALAVAVAVAVHTGNRVRATKGSCTMAMGCWAARKAGGTSRNRSTDRGFGSGTDEADARCKTGTFRIELQIPGLAISLALIIRFYAVFAIKCFLSLVLRVGGTTSPHQLTQDAG